MPNKGDLYECENMAVICQIPENTTELQIQCEIIIDGERHMVSGETLKLKEIMQAEEDFGFVFGQTRAGKVVLWVPEDALSLKLVMKVPIEDGYKNVVNQYNTIGVVGARREYLKYDPDDEAFARCVLTEAGEKLLDQITQRRECFNS